MSTRKTDLGTLITDDKGREVLRFVTPSGVTAIIDTSISMTALASFARSLERKMRRAGNWPSTHPSEAAHAKARPRSKAT
jgi:hypothetical protein